MPRIVTASPERVLAMVACAEGIGVPRGSGMFRHALQSVACFSEEKIAAKVEQLKKTLRGSDADVGIALCKWPTVLRWSKDMLQRKSEVLISKGIGVPRGSGMFRHALQSVACFSEEKIAAKVEQLKKTLRWSDADVGIALCKWPTVLRWSKDMLQRKSEFLISKVGLEPAYIAHRPVMLSLSLEGRLKPRYYVMRFLQENGLLSHGRDYYAMVLVGEKVAIKDQTIVVRITGLPMWQKTMSSRGPGGLLSNEFQIAFIRNMLHGDGRVAAVCPSCYVPGFLLLKASSLYVQAGQCVADGQASCTVDRTGRGRLRSFAPPVLFLIGSLRYPLES
uniref:Uncharacterized protein n=1 Tax=Aegilops tauschii TaxID=37682 RepID=R7W002_AEGTA